MTSSQTTTEQAMNAARAASERVGPVLSDVADTAAGTVKQAATAVKGVAEPVASNLQHNNRSRKMAGLTALALLAAAIAVLALRRRS